MTAQVTGGAGLGPQRSANDASHGVKQRPDQGRGRMDTYICGLKDMVVSTRQMLIEEFGWDKKTVLFERFD